jgi:hypothetical protein
MTCEQINELAPLYLSGQLDDGRTAEFAQHLVNCADCDLDQRVRAALLAEPIDIAPLERSIRQQMRSRRVPRWAIAVAASIAIMIGGGLAYRVFFGAPVPPICIAAAQDHEREIVNGEPRRWLSDPSAIDALAEKHGVPAAAISALDATGYRLERARLCFLKKQIFVHLVYTKNGGEFSVYLRPRGELAGNSVQETEIGPDGLAYFQSDRLTAVFVSHQSSANVLAFARTGLHALTAVAL